MTEPRFNEGDRVLIVEHDAATRQPREGGEVTPGRVTQALKLYAQVTLDNGPRYTFWQESGWYAWDGDFRWRLMPAPSAATPAVEGEN